MDAVFDKHAKEYDKEHQEAVRASGFGSSYFYEYKVKEVHRILSKRKIAHPRRILDFGCGVGNIDPYIRKYFPDAEIYGTDISGESINEAQEKNKEHKIDYAVFDGKSNPFNTLYDMVFVSCVFHHIPKKLHGKTLALIESWMGQEALFFVFEHNPYNPLTRMVFRKYDIPIDENAAMIRPCCLKRQIEQSGLKVLKRNFTVFFPKALSIFTPLERYISIVPFGAQYYVMAQKQGICL